jgi:DnaB-like helicase C terminal domain
MTTDRIESIILHSLMSNQKYGDTFLPHLKPELFGDRTERAICEGIRRYRTKYQQVPTAQAVTVTLSDQDLSQEDYEEAVKHVEAMDEWKSAEPDAWLEDQTAKFIRDRSLFNAVLDLIHAQDGRNTKRSIEQCVEEICKANLFTLDQTPGLGLDWEPLFEYLQSPDEKFPFQVDILNKMTCGGPSRKTVTVVVAPTNSGKSLILCHQAAEYLRQGRNVIYITLEMADKIVLKRIFANLLDTDMNVLEGWTKDQWAVAVEGLGKLGKLKVREYASRSAHVGNFRQYLAELKSKEKFVPDVIIVDYLNECRSQSMKFGQSVGSYQYFGSICSELRALATDCNAVVWTATQTNRDGYEGDPDLKNTSESAQINSGADLSIGVQKDDNLQDALLFRVLKNRDAEHKDRKFMVGVDRRKMRLFDRDDPEKVAEQMNVKRGEIQMRKSRKPSFA